MLVFCDSQPRVQMLRCPTVSRSNLQKDGVTLLQASMLRYVESTFSVVRSVMEARQFVQSPVKSAEAVDQSSLSSVNWDESMVLIFLYCIISCRFNRWSFYFPGFPWWVTYF